MAGSMATGMINKEEVHLLQQGTAPRPSTNGDQASNHLPMEAILIRNTTGTFIGWIQFGKINKHAFPHILDNVY